MTLKELRIKRNWTQKDLAEKVGIDRSMITFIEKRTAKASYYTADRIAHLFNIPLEEIEDFEYLKRKSPYPEMKGDKI